MLSLLQTYGLQTLGGRDRGYLTQGLPCALVFRTFSAWVFLVRRYSLLVKGQVSVYRSVLAPNSDLLILGKGGIFSLAWRIECRIFFTLP